MEIQEQASVAQQAAAGDVAVAEDGVAAGVGGGVGAHQRDDLRPVRQIAVVAVHDLDLAEVDRLETHVDVRGREEVEPEPGFGLAHVGDGGVSSPVAALSLGVDHVGVAEVPFLDGLAQGDERPLGHGHLLDLGADALEDAGLQDHLRIGGVDLGDQLIGPFEVSQQVGLVAPEADASADELGAGGLEHADVVVEVAAAVQHAFHRDRAGEVIVEDTREIVPSKR